jgi:hypothetical protein
LAALFQELEPVVAHLRELDEVAVGVVDRGADEKSGVRGRVEQLYALVFKAFDQRLGIER